MQYTGQAVPMHTRLMPSFMCSRYGFMPALQPQFCLLRQSTPCTQPQQLTEAGSFVTQIKLSSVAEEGSH
jgi:hypothetical protein